MTYEYKQYLAHHDIKGRKWGVRRYQNDDGSLTDEGIKRYQKYKDLVSKYRETKQEAYISPDNKWRSLNRKADRYAKKAAKIEKKTADKIDFEKYRKSVLSDKDYDKYNKSLKIINDEYEKFKGDQKARRSAAKKLLDHRIEIAKRSIEKGYDYKYDKDMVSMSKKSKKAWIDDMAKAFDYSIDAHDDMWFTHVDSIPKYSKAQDFIEGIKSKFDGMPFSEYLKYY